MARRASTTPDGGGELVLFDGRLDAGLQVQVADMEGQVELTGASITVPKPARSAVPESRVGARVSGKAGAGDALTMAWKDAGFASLRLVASRPLDLRPYWDGGTLEFDVDAIDMARAGLSFAMGCGNDCVRKLPFVLPSRALQGKGWHHLSIPLQCFERDGNDFSAVTAPFVVESSGSGEVAVANIRIVRNGRPNTGCLDYRNESVTPAPLEEVGSLDWWMPRHENKLQELRELRAAGLDPEIVFVGDSITHGWEDSGLAVWNEHYRRHHALDLGFSGDRTENVLWRLQHGEVDGLSPKVTVLMIGTNNTGHRQEDPRTTAAGIRRIVDELRQRLPRTKILLLAVFPRDEQPASRLRRINDRVNALISNCADGRNVFFLDINESLTNPDGTLSREVFPDLLHVSEMGYALWAESMAPMLRRLLGTD